MSIWGTSVVKYVESCLKIGEKVRTSEVGLWTISRPYPEICLRCVRKRSKYPNGVTISGQDFGTSTSEQKAASATAKLNSVHQSLNANVCVIALKDERPAAHSFGLHYALSPPRHIQH